MTLFLGELIERLGTVRCPSAINQSSSACCSRKSFLLDIFMDFRSHDSRVAWYLLSFKMRRYSMPPENSDYDSALLSAN